MFNWRRPVFAALVTMIAVVALVGCEGTEDPNIPGTLNVRVLHASPDAPRINVTVEGQVGTREIPRLDYKKATFAADKGSTFIPVRFGKTSVKAEAILPDGTTSTIFEFTDADITWAEDTNYDFIVFDTYAGAKGFGVTNPQSAVTTDMFRAQVVHASPGITASVRVYITTPNIVLDGTTPFVPATFDVYPADPMEYMAGEMRIRVAPDSDPLNPMFDTGTINVLAGADLLIAAVDNSTTSTELITLVAMDNSATIDLVDKDTESDLRLVHALPDTPEIDLVIDDTVDPPVIINPAVTNLAFRSFTDYLPPLAPKTEAYNFKFVETVSTTLFIEANWSLLVGSAYTLLGIGLSEIPNAASMLMIDDNRRIVTEAKLRFAHTSILAGVVDLYIADAGTGANITPENLVLINLPIGFDSGYLSREDGSFEVTLTAPGEITDIKAGPLPITIADNGVYTAVIVDSAGSGGAQPIELLLMDDFAP